MRFVSGLELWVVGCVDASAHGRREGQDWLGLGELICFEMALSSAERDAHT